MTDPEAVLRAHDRLPAREYTRWIESDEGQQTLAAVRRAVAEQRRAEKRAERGKRP